MSYSIETSIESGIGAGIKMDAETCVEAVTVTAVTNNEQKKAQDFSAGAGLLIVVTLFFMFFMVPMATLISVGLEIDLLPIVMTVMVSTVIVASFFLLLRVIDRSFK
jgi:nitrate reductase gamma subunit